MENMETTTMSVAAKASLSQTTEQQQKERDFGSQELQALAKIESSLMKGAKRYIEEKDFVWINAPHITKATGSCENFSTMFKMNYFGKQAYLSQTGQLYLEVLTPSLKKVWTVIHSFRAEPGVDSRHLTEFPLIEIEFEGNFEQLLGHIEGTISSMINTTAQERKAELSLFGIDSAHIARFAAPYARITYGDAIELLQENGMDIKFGDDIKTAHEQMISKHFDYKPFFLTHWPEEIKFFNMRTSENDARLVNSCDLIMPFSGEAVGGAEREHNYERLKEKLEKSKMLELLKQAGGTMDDFDWYFSFYKNNKASLHSGCGIGFNRVTQSLLKLGDIRDCTVFPQNSAVYW